MTPNALSKSWRPWLLAGVGVLVFHLLLILSGGKNPLWLPALGWGLALVAWLGYWILPALAVDGVVALSYLPASETAALPGGNVLQALLVSGEIGAAWWIYRRLGGGTRRLEDPHSATLFLILVPGAAAALFAGAHTIMWSLGPGAAPPTLAVFSMLWLSRALGILALVPALLVVATPLLTRAGWLEEEKEIRPAGGVMPLDWTWGELVETGGLCLGAGVLGVVLVLMHVDQTNPRLTLWGVSLLLVVWASLRQGLRGGALTALVSALTALVLAQVRGINPTDFSPLQGNILAQCSAALLVGASAGWIRASEARYRQVVGHIPVVLYSAHLPRALRMEHYHKENQAARTEARPDQGNFGLLLAQQAEVTLISPACRKVFGCHPDDLLGPFSQWLDRVMPEDRELVVAALTQLGLQKQPLTCEYRVMHPEPSRPPSVLAGDLAPLLPKTTSFRWVRDTLAPHHDGDGGLDGWEGVIEDITEQRALSHNLRRTAGMLQALVANLPTGVFFVQGPLGTPLLVNHRARQLLGQREEMAAGLAHLSKVYRLHRPDGSEYPPEELPVARALETGVPQMANDVVVHRADGRRIPLITWAAPLYLSSKDKPDAAVWVLEDLTALQQAETAKRDTEARLRAVFQTMAEGVVVINEQGAVVECNPAACAILQVTQEKLLGRAWLESDYVCVKSDGAALPPDEHPDRLVLRLGQPVRDVVLGVPVRPDNQASPSYRWLYINALPLVQGPHASLKTRQARAVLTFADITAHRQAEEKVRHGHRVELIGRLASGIIHDFNNMLTVMLGLASIAHDSLPQDNPVREDLNRLVEVGEQAGALAGQLLAFSKQRRQNQQQVNLNLTVRTALKMLHSALPPSIQVEKHLLPKDVLVQADETQLKQVIVNLLLNAREAMPQGGRLLVTTEMSGPPQKLGALALPTPDPDEPWVHFAVQDTGEGMDETVQARIFEPFFTTKERGTGLGLAVVRQIVEDFGGQIQVWSKPGQGTRMSIWLKTWSNLS